MTPFDYPGYPIPTLFAFEDLTKGVSDIRHPPSDVGRVFFMHYSKNAANTYQEAENFGTPVCLFAPNTLPSRDPDRYLKMLRQFFMDEGNFDPENDYLASVGGDPLTPVLVGLVLSEFYAGETIKWLYWRRQGDDGILLPSSFNIPGEIDG